MNTKQQFDETKRKQRLEIIDLIESGKKPDFDLDKWWEPLVDEYNFYKKRNKRKYPYILFKRILKQMRNGNTYPVPSLFELKVGVCHGNQAKVEDYCRKGMMVHSWYFPKLEDIAGQIDPHQNDGIVHLHSWQRKLAEEKAPWARLEAFLHQKRGDQEKYHETMQAVKQSESKNVDLTAKVAQLEQELAEAKGKKNGTNSNKGKVARKPKAEPTEQSSNDLQGDLGEALAGAGRG